MNTKSKLGVALAILTPTILGAWLGFIPTIARHFSDFVCFIYVMNFFGIGFVCIGGSIVLIKNEDF